MTRIAINGFGRMGKLALRRLFDEGLGDQVVLINEPTGDVAQHALLLEFDTVHGRWACAVAVDVQSMTVNGQTISFTQSDTIED